MSNEQLKTAKVETMNCNGTASSATCPYCGKIKFLSHELNTLQAFCDKCHKPFKLEKDGEGEQKSATNRLVQINYAELETRIIAQHISGKKYSPVDTGRAETRPEMNFGEI